MTETPSHAARYTTVDGEHRHELEVKRSRFITVLRRVETEGDARDLVAGLRREFHDARHHCSAFVLGPDRTTQRSSDDGEPAGTAGIPMLEALLKRETHDGAADLSDVVAVVVRYFGGVLLGAGGLVRAYSESVSSALDTARLVRRQRLRILGVATEHAVAPRLENDLRSAGVVVLGTDYGARSATLRIAVEDSDAEAAAFEGRLASLSAGSARADALGTSWVDVP
ncbi:IMPACT family protein [Sinomonas flava]|uniref:IMPACT family protein n=1 Tax=Sinomonas flava TaxID=496857 RepID=UPI0039A42295